MLPSLTTKFHFNPLALKKAYTNLKLDLFSIASRVANPSRSSLPAACGRSQTWNNSNLVSHDTFLSYVGQQS